MAEALVVAIDNGGTNTRVAARLGSEILDVVSFPTPSDYHEGVNLAADSIRHVTAGKKPAAIGYAVAGQVDDGRIIRAGELQDYGWTGRPLAADVAAALAIDKSQVALINDCVAAAKSQQVVNQQAGEPTEGYIITLSTGFGGAGFTDTDLIPDEPGHAFLRKGAICGCGEDGHVEAHVSGSGIQRKFGVPADKLSDRKWRRVVFDLRDAHLQLLQRLATEKGLKPSTLYYFGSIATRSPHALPGLAARLMTDEAKPTYLESMKMATFRNDSGLHGAAQVALDLAEQL